ncbi:MAG: ABC transporter permease, partial [Deltaproteobacteria bacterium]
MSSLAWRNLFHDKVRFAVTITGIVFSIILIVVLMGLFLGFNVTILSLVDNSGADIWITTKNIPYLE